MKVRTRAFPPAPETVSRNMVQKPDPGTTRRLFDSALAAIGSLLPNAWQVDSAGRSNAGGAARVTAPDGAAGQITILARYRLAAREASALPPSAGTSIIAASWLSPRTREILEQAGRGYVDQTGNVCLTMNRPGLALRAQGADRDPSPEPAKRPNLRGARAWALLRTLAEVRPPYGVGDLSAALRTDPGYISRLLAALSEELLIEKKPRGPVRHVEWESILRQMAVTYSMYGANDTTSWVAGGGPEQFLSDLASSGEKGWALTGSFASSALVSVTVPLVAVVYTEDPDRLAGAALLRRVRIGGNVTLARPYNRIVFERTWRRGDPVNASLAQVAVDCLTGPGRLPSEGEALLEWMRNNAPRWQAPSLTIRADIP